MKVGIMQPYLFPYIGYWQLINAVDKYIIYDDVNFIKGGWINRNRILMNCEPKMINLQLKGASPNKLINEVEVFENEIHNKKLLKTIENCYKKAPYFSKAFPIFEDIITQDEENLAHYLEYSISKICNYLSIKTELIVSSKFNKNNSLKGQDKVIDICKKIGGNEYYNAIGGKELYSYADFAINGIKLVFLKNKGFDYKQFNNVFVPDLSIIDVMMFNEPKEINIMLENYELL